MGLTVVPAGPDHAREKHGAGDPSGMDASSHQVNPTCGDEVKASL